VWVNVSELNVTRFVHNVGAAVRLTEFMLTNRPKACYA